MEGAELLLQGRQSFPVSLRLPLALLQKQCASGRAWATAWLPLVIKYVIHAALFQACHVTYIIFQASCRMIG